MNAVGNPEKSSELVSLRLVGDDIASEDNEDNEDDNAEEEEDDVGDCTDACGIGVDCCSSAIRVVVVVLALRKQHTCTH